jgi:two-component system sensor histidine kinase KdpD
MAAFPSTYSRMAEVFGPPPPGRKGRSARRNRDGRRTIAGVTVREGGGRRLGTWRLPALPGPVGVVLPYLLAAAGVALVTLGIALASRPDLANASMLYLIVVLVAAVGAGRAVAIFSALLAFFSFNWFLTEPRHTLAVADPDDWILLLLFLLTAIVTGQLAAGQKRRAEEAEEHERHARVLTDIAVALTEPTLDRTLGSVAQRLRQELGVEAVQVELGGARATSGTDASALAALEPADRTVDVLSADRGQRPRWVRLAPPHGRATGRSSAYRLARAAIRSQDGDGVGEITLATRRDGAFDASAARLLVAVVPQLWAAEERARLRTEATEAEVLRRSDEAKSALLDAVSHDLRTPLASIIASAGSLRQSGVEWSDDERAEFAAAIEQEARRLDRIVGNLLDLSRIRAGSLHPDVAWYEPVALIRDVLARLAGVTATHRLLMDLPDELPPVPLDYSEIDQVLTNLVENAVRHSPPGTIVTVSARSTGVELQVCVEDSGPGIPSADLPRIFEPFHRVRGAARRGTGLGLAVARGLVEAHRGRIWAEARDEGGTRFCFVIPSREVAP